MPVFAVSHFNFSTPLLLPSITFPFQGLYFSLSEKDILLCHCSLLPFNPKLTHLLARVHTHTLTHSLTHTHTHTQTICQLINMAFVYIFADFSVFRKTSESNQDNGLALLWISDERQKGCIIIGYIVLFCHFKCMYSTVVVT